MGYSTDFEGRFELDKPLSEAHATYLRLFSDTRRVSRLAALTMNRPDEVREAVGLPVGIEGGYFVGAGDFMGQERTPDVLDYNNPPKGQPGLWCQWVPSNDLEGIEWNGTEKFYYYAEWLEYIIEHFLKPWGYVLKGKVDWQGEDSSDRGRLEVKDNVLTVKDGKVIYKTRKSA